MSTFQENLRYYREKAGYHTVKAFVKDLGIPYTTYLDYEKGLKDASGKNIVKIADKLGISTDELLGRTPTVIYSDSIPKEVADLISRKAEEVKQQYIRDCLETYSHYRKKVQ